MKKKKVILAIIIALASLSTVIAATFAYFTGEDVIKNTFTLGEIKISLDEPNWNSDSKGNNLLPGTTLLKDPIITGEKGNSYCRIIVEFLDEDNNVITDKNRIKSINELIYYDTSYDKTKAQGINLIETSTYTGQ